MTFTPYTLALSDFAILGIVVVIVFAALFFFGDWICDFFDPCDGEYLDPEDDARFEEPTREETGIACELLKLPPGSQLIECDTAGMLTPPGLVFVHEYVWTGSAIEFVRRVPLHEFSFAVPAPSEALAKEGLSEWPELKQAREQFQHTAALVSNGSPLGRKAPARSASRSDAGGSEF